MGWKVYVGISSGLPEQDELSTELAGVVERCGLAVYSPFREGMADLLRQTTKDDHSFSARLRHLSSLLDCDIFLLSTACECPRIMWEMGYGWAMGKIIVSFSNGTEPVNGFSVFANARSITELDGILTDLRGIHFPDDHQASEELANQFSKIHAKWNAGSSYIP